jgi:hypothetical protein
MTRDREALDPDLLSLARALGRYQAQLDLRQASADAPAEPGPDEADHGTWVPSRRTSRPGEIEMGCLVHKTSPNQSRTYQSR